MSVNPDLEVIVPTPAELLARARAIVAYAAPGRDKARAALLKDAGIEDSDWKTWNEKRRPDSMPHLEDVVRLAGAAGVPRRFAERGFADLQEPDEKLAEIHGVLSDIQQRVSAHGEGDDRLDDLTAEQAVEVMRAATRAMEQVLGRLGSGISKRALQSQRARDRSHQASVDDRREGRAA